MKMILSLILAGIFFCLSALHFYWVSGGNWGFEKTLPTNENGTFILNPGKIDTIFVGLILISFGLFYLFESNIIKYDLPEWVMKYSGWIITLLFFIRAIGDFKYVGFFKSIRHTEFGHIDTILYSPFCLLIGIIGLIILKIR